MKQPFFWRVFEYCTYIDVLRLKNRYDGIFPFPVQLPCIHVTNLEMFDIIIILMQCILKLKNFCMSYDINQKSEKTPVQVSFWNQIYDCIYTYTEKINDNKIVKPEVQPKYKPIIIISNILNIKIVIISVGSRLKLNKIIRHFGFECTF